VLRDQTHRGCDRIPHRYRAIRKSTQADIKKCRRYGRDREHPNGLRCTNVSRWQLAMTRTSTGPQPPTIHADREVKDLQARIRVESCSPENDQVEDVVCDSNRPVPNVLAGSQPHAHPTGQKAQQLHRIHAVHDNNGLAFNQLQTAALSPARKLRTMEVWASQNRRLQMPAPLFSESLCHGGELTFINRPTRTRTKKAPSSGRRLIVINHQQETLIRLLDLLHQLQPR